MPDTYPCQPSHGACAVKHALPDHLGPSSPRSGTRARPCRAAAMTASPRIRSGAVRPRHDPSCSRAPGSGRRDHPSRRHVPAGGRIRGRRSPGSGGPVAIRSAGRRPACSGLEGGPPRDGAPGRVPPEGRRELPGERHGRDPADPPAPSPDAPAEPDTRGGVRPVAEPGPGEPDRGVARPAVAGPRDALPAPGPAAPPRATSSSCKSRARSPSTSARSWASVSAAASSRRRGPAGSSAGARLTATATSPAATAPAGGSRSTRPKRSSSGRSTAGWPTSG